jgi:hypothetical protein
MLVYTMPGFWKGRAGAPAFSSFALSADDGQVSSKAVTISAAAGELLIGIGSLRGAGLNLNAIAGWTQLFSGENAHGQNANFKTRNQWRVAPGGGISNPALTITGGNSDEWGWGCLKIAGANAATPIHQAAILESTGSGTTNPDAPSVTTTVPNCLIVRIAVSAGQVASQDSGYPASHTGVFARNVLGPENSQSIAVAWAVQTTAGATGVADFSALLGSITDWFGITLAIRS